MRQQSTGVLMKKLPHLNKAMLFRGKLINNGKKEKKDDISEQVQKYTTLFLFTDNRY